VHVAYGRTSMGWAGSCHQDERAEAFEADAEHGQRVVWNGAAGPLAGSCSRLARLSRILQHGVMCVCGVVDVARGEREGSMRVREGRGREGCEWVSRDENRGAPVRIEKYRSDIVVKALPNPNP